MVQQNHLHSHKYFELPDFFSPGQRRCGKNSSPRVSDVLFTWGLSVCLCLKFELLNGSFGFSTGLQWSALCHPDVWEEGRHLTTHSLKCLMTLSLVTEFTLFSVLFAILVYFPVLCFWIFKNVHNVVCKIWRTLSISISIHGSCLAGAGVHIFLSTINFFKTYFNVRKII